MVAGADILVMPSPARPAAPGADRTEWPPGAGAAPVRAGSAGRGTVSGAGPAQPGRRAATAVASRSSSCTTVGSRPRAVERRAERVGLGLADLDHQVAARGEPVRRVGGHPAQHGQPVRRRRRAPPGPRAAAPPTASAPPPRSARTGRSPPPGRAGPATRPGQRREQVALVHRHAQRGEVAPGAGHRRRVDVGGGQPAGREPGVQHQGGGAGAAAEVQHGRARDRSPPRRRRPAARSGHAARRRRGRRRPAGRRTRPSRAGTPAAGRRPGGRPGRSAPRPSRRRRSAVPPRPRRRRSRRRAAGARGRDGRGGTRRCHGNLRERSSALPASPTSRATRTRRERRSCAGGSVSPPPVGARVGRGCPSR